MQAPRTNFAAIFKYQKIGPSVVISNLDDVTTIQKFCIFDDALVRCVQELHQQRNVNSGIYKKLTERVHRLQKHLLAAFDLIYESTPSTVKSSRSYRNLLPYEDQRELSAGFSENILFAAQALNGGFRIRDIEMFTDTLKQSAQYLCAAFEALRFVLRQFTSMELTTENILTNLGQVIGDFDSCWATFEQRICYCYFSLIQNRPDQSSHEMHINSLQATVMTRNLGEISQADLLTLLMSETLEYCLREQLVLQEDVNEQDPLLIFALPRLMLVQTLLSSPEFLVSENIRCNVLWFRDDLQQLKFIRSSLTLMNNDEVYELRQMLINRDYVRDSHSKPDDDQWHNSMSCLAMLSETSTLDGYAPSLQQRSTSLQASSAQDNLISVSVVSHFQMLHTLFKSICQLSDALHQGRHAQEMTFILSRVFKMHSTSTLDEQKVVCTNNRSSRGEAGQLSGNTSSPADEVWNQVLRSIQNGERLNYTNGQLTSVQSHNNSIQTSNHQRRHSNAIHSRAQLPSYRSRLLSWWL
ncbi:hypothetical protein MIR68_010971 [Amoeboaphelidium protococcarum]|nr:hypothetical protein MIR68_010971 [Amoeboaphelidium protococcarum]